MNRDLNRSGEAEPADGSPPAFNGAELAFTDARLMHSLALDRLRNGDIRDVAEKAWCAHKRAADGLILARTGEAPRKSPETTRDLRRLGMDDEEVRALVTRYSHAQGVLHGECFYLGLCEPVDDTLRLIRETVDYIDDAERLAAVQHRIHRIGLGGGRAGPSAAPPAVLGGPADRRATRPIRGGAVA
ncbi:MAG: hypothetical protein F4110_15515, partial [Acidimicrobiaceae bacterium]|nr:hypothetical protein [Acidimicrobiaceae bacterium]